MNTFNKVPVHKTNSQNSVDSLYTNNKWTGKEIREKAPLTPQIISDILGVILAEQVKDLCDKNFWALTK